MEKVYKYRDFYVPSSYRESVLNTYFKKFDLTNEMLISYLRFYSYLTSRQENQGYVSIKYQTLDYFYQGLGISYRSRKALKLKAFLFYFSQNVIELDIIEYVPPKLVGNNSSLGKSTLVKFKYIEDLSISFLSSSKDSVAFSTGKSSSRKDSKIMSSIDTSLTQKEINDKLIVLLNGQAKRSFSSAMSKNMKEAELYAETKKENGLVYQNLKLSLASIATEWKPEYYFSKNTDRIYAHNFNVTNIQSSARKILCKNCLEIDMKNAQIAILNKVIPNTLLSKYLNKNKSVWDYFYNLGFSVKDKPVLKKTVYSIIFGQSINNTHQNLEEVLGNDNTIKIMTSSLIKDLYSVRELAYDTINKSKGMYDRSGEFILLENQEAHKVLATVIQNFEYYFMSLLAVSLKNKYERLTIIAWQHDGMTLFSSASGQYISIQKTIDFLFKELCSKENLISSLDSVIL